MRLNRILLGTKLFILAGLMVVVSLPSVAGILGDGNVVLDTDTGLEYLHSRYTAGTFPNQYMFPQVGIIRPIPEGYRVATQAEALSLFRAVGLAPELTQSTGAYTAADTLLTFIGHPYVFNNGRITRSYEVVTFTQTPEPFDHNLNYISYVLRVDEAYEGDPSPTGSLNIDAHKISNASVGTGALMVRSRANATPAAAIAPTVTEGASRTFNNVNGKGVWVNSADPGSNSLLKIRANSGNITHVGIASTYTDADNQVGLMDGGNQIYLQPGDVHQLANPVSMVTLMGLGDDLLAPLAISTGPGDLPLFLAFDGETADFEITTVGIPEPGTLLVLLVGGMGMVRRRAS